MKADEFDKIFDDGKEDILHFFDMSSATRPNRQSKKVNVDFPLWMVQSLDKEAHKYGVPRQSLIKMWLAERLENNARPTE